MGNQKEKLIRPYFRSHGRRRIFLAAFIQVHYKVGVLPPSPSLRLLPGDEVCLGLPLMYVLVAALTRSRSR